MKSKESSHHLWMHRWLMLTSWKSLFLFLSIFTCITSKKSSTGESYEEVSPLYSTAISEDLQFYIFQIYPLKGIEFKHLAQRHVWRQAWRRTVHTVHTCKSWQVSEVLLSGKHREPTQTEMLQRRENHPQKEKCDDIITMSSLKGSNYASSYTGSYWNQSSY